MESIFEPSLMLDPTSHLDPTFLSFSSFGDISATTDYSSWELPLSDLYQKSNPPSDASDTSSPTDPFQLNNGGLSLFEPATPAGDIGIFHTPSKLVESSSSLANAACRASTSSEWGVPITPKSSESVVVSGLAITPGSFSWDDFSTGSSSSHPTTIAPTTCAPSGPLRVASNPTLGAAARIPVVKNVSSMSTLKEDPFASSSGSTPVDAIFGDVHNGSTELADELDWAFGQYSLGGSHALDDTIFAAFNEPSTSETPADDALVLDATVPELTISASALDAELVTPGIVAPAPMGDLSWVPVDESSAQAAVDPSAIFAPAPLRPNTNMTFDNTTFTINPMAVMNQQQQQQSERPLSAPGLTDDLPLGASAAANEPLATLTAPVYNTMGRSLSTNAVPLSKHNLSQHDILYASPSGPLYAASQTPQLLAGQYPRALPLNSNASFNPTHPQLQVQINADASFASYMPSNTVPPLTPQSATFPVDAPMPMGMQHLSMPGADGSFGMPIVSTPTGLTVPMPMPVTMARAGTQPLPTTRKLSTGNGNGLPAHLARAQAIVQMQEAQVEAERQALRRDAATRRMNMAQASVMQPTISMPGLPSQTTIMGWEGPSAQTSSLPVLTTAPLVTIHPPPMAYYTLPGSVPAPHRVHPPPYAGMGIPGRPIANLPSPSKRRASPSSALPPTGPAPKTPTKQRSPSSNKRKVTPPAAGGFSWGSATFINFTSDDADKILTGVAPSGSQSKRKREEAAAVVGVNPISVDDPVGKRVRSD